MGLFSFVGGLLGGGSQKKAAKKAAKAQNAAIDRAIAEQRRQFDITQANFAPAQKMLAPAVGGLGDLIGTNGEPAQQSAIDQLKNSPFFKTLFRTGEENVLQTASATGGLRGGNTERSLADFGSDTLMQTIQQQLANLGGLANIGMGATNSTAQFGAHASDNISEGLTNQGKNTAAKDLAIGGINAQMWNNAGAFADQAVSAFMPGGGGMGSIFKGF